MGHDVVLEPEGVRRNLGFSSSTTALYPRLTARETLEFFARINGWPEAAVRDRVDRLDRPLRHRRTTPTPGWTSSPRA